MPSTCTYTGYVHGGGIVLSQQEHLGNQGHLSQMGMRALRDQGHFKDSETSPLTETGILCTDLETQLMAGVVDPSKSTQPVSEFSISRGSGEGMQPETVTAPYPSHSRMYGSRSIMALR